MWPNTNTQETEIQEFKEIEAFIERRRENIELRNAFHGSLGEGDSSEFNLIEALFAFSSGADTMYYNELLTVEKAESLRDQGAPVIIWAKALFRSAEAADMAHTICDSVELQLHVHELHGVDGELSLQLVTSYVEDWYGGMQEWCEYE